MGNDQSRLKGLQIDKNAVEINDFWSLYNAEIPKDDNSTLLSIFQEETVVNGQLWIMQTPLRRAAKNLMIYRHPCILKYITSWDQGSKKYLATERCRPLSLVIQLQNDIQICLGLKNILSSLIFLVEQAKSHHLNVCMSSIYVNSDGEWRLGGFEYVWKSKELTKNLLDLSKSYRYQKAIDINETKNFNNDNDDNDNNCGIEQYSFATLCDELLKNHSKKSSNIPYIKEFHDYCLIHLKHSNIQMRPKLSAVLLHPYFNHEFILIHTFLTELPLKGPKEKQDFFTSLIDRLRYFDENMIASQIGGLLLSRMVLLDTTAKLCVTPYILKTKSNQTSAIFSNHTYIKYIIPQIKKIFYVRDTQIRLILLEYFNEYIKLLTKDELKEQILPNLLLGIKDTNDILVEKTLRCLADLIPILGSKIVIGNNYRKKLFADGRPQQQNLLNYNNGSNNGNGKSYLIEPRSITPVIISDDYNVVSASPLPPNDDNTYNDDTISESFISMTPTTITTATTAGNPNNINIQNNNNNIENILIMPERLSPDGGEDIQNLIDGDIEDEEDAWSDWDNNDEINRITMNAVAETTETIETGTEMMTMTLTTTENSTVSTFTNEISINHNLDTNLINKKLQIPSSLVFEPSPSLSVKQHEHQQQQIEQTRSPNKTIDIVDDINKLDIKNQKFKLKQKDEIDFFKDMEPIIQSTKSNMNINNTNNLFNLEKIEINLDENIEIDKNRFAIKIDDHESITCGNGWKDNDDIEVNVDIEDNWNV